MVGTSAISYVEPGDAARMGPAHEKLLTQPGVHLSFSFRVRAKDSVTSRVGAGTRIEILLPPTQSEPDGATRDAGRSAGLSGGETVLLVEDDASVRQILRLILEAAGYKILAASGGEEALAIAGNLGTPVDLLITDLVMPKMNGRQIADHLLQLRPNIKVIFTSGYTDDVLSRQGVLDPKVHFIQKPFDVRGLRAKVRQVLDE